jgi:hypothetical protein
MSETIINVTISEETPIAVTFECCGGGIGDMLKSVYDIDDDGIVDKAESLDNGDINVTALEVYNHINNEEIHREINYDVDYRSFLIEYS